MDLEEQLIVISSQSIDKYENIPPSIRWDPPPQGLGHYNEHHLLDTMPEPNKVHMVKKSVSLRNKLPKHENTQYLCDWYFMEFVKIKLTSIAVTKRATNIPPWPC